MFFRNIVQENRKTLVISTIIFILFLTTWVLVFITRLGFSASEDYWYEAGVPILLQQVVLSLAIGLGFGIAEKKFAWGRYKRTNSIIFLIVWIFAAILWAIQPVHASYVNPAPRLPNWEMYPYSDGTKYDIASQFALIGQGLNNHRKTDAPLYPLFLVFVHAVSGQNYQINMAVQAAVLAVLPALMYLIGNILYGRILGVVLASLIALRGINSIEAASIINTASPKQMLTDFPVAIGIALVLLFFLLWSDKQKKPFLVYFGACIGFAFLIRANSLALIGCIALIAFLPNLPRTKRWFFVLIAFLGFLVAIMPWGIRNIVYSENRSSYIGKIDLVIRKRFPEAKEWRAESTPGPKNAANGFPEEKNLNEKKTPPQGALTAVEVISNHFVHNLITSVLVLPTYPSFSSLRETIKSPNMYWKPFWNGALSTRSFLFLLISLGVLALGMGASVIRKGIMGLAPLFAFLLYQFANAIGRTSGGRYIVPVDWIVILYFAIGLIELFFILTNNRFFRKPQPDSAPLAFAFSDNLPRAFMFVFALALILPLSEMLFPPAYPQLAKTEGEKQISVSPAFLSATANIGYSEEQIVNFLKTDKRSILLNGRALYPRYFFPREVMQSPEDAIYNLAYPRLEFTLIGPDDRQTVLLASQNPVELQNTSDVFVLGCSQESGNVRSVDAIAIIPYRPEQQVLMRQPLTPLQCPLPEMVCDNNANCK